MVYTFPHNNVITSEGLECLRLTFDDWCTARDIHANCEEAEDVACRLMTWYQMGITDQKQLASLISLI